MSNKIYSQLVDLKHYLNPHDEFMCIKANTMGLLLAQDVVQASVKAKGELCLQTHWEKLRGYKLEEFHWTHPEYQEFRIEWLDQLIEEYK